MLHVKGFHAFLTGSFGMMNISGRAAAFSYVSNTTAELATSTPVQSTACSLILGRGPTARPVPRNRQGTRSHGVNSDSHLNSTFSPHISKRPHYCPWIKWTKKMNDQNKTVFLKALKNTNKGFYL